MYLVIDYILIKPQKIDSKKDSPVNQSTQKSSASHSGEPESTPKASTAVSQKKDEVVADL